MADEIKLTAILTAEKNGVKVEPKPIIGRLFDMSGDEHHETIQVVGTSEEAIDLNPDIGTLGYVLLENLDDDNFISIRAGTGLGNVIRLDANGGFALFKWGSGATAPFAIADTAACRMRITQLEA